MSHVNLIETLYHIRDLETYLIHCRDAINDIDEDLEQDGANDGAGEPVLLHQGSGLLLGDGRGEEGAEEQQS